MFPTLPMVDEQDFKILKELKLDSRLTTRQIAKRTKLSSATVHRRIINLVKDGVIKQFTIEPDWRKLGMNTVAYVHINVDYALLKKQKKTQDAITDSLKKHPSVITANTITGGKDILLKIRLKDSEQLHKFINYLRTCEGVMQTETSVVLYESERHDNPFDKAEF